MRLLHHFWLCPFSRKLRIVLEEKSLSFELKFEKFWERKQEFLAMNPAGQVPILFEGGEFLADSNVVCEYLDEVYPEPSLYGSEVKTKAEVRRLVSWFDLKFNNEVTRPLIEEKVMKRFMGMGQPNSEVLRAGRKNILYHLEYIGWLTERRNWLGGDDLSLADISAASHLSCIDYVGDVPWSDFELAKNWYARVKSRPSFRKLLSDSISGLTPPRHYADLDF